MLIIKSQADKFKSIVFTVILMCLMVPNKVKSFMVLDLQEAVSQAIKQDKWLLKNHHLQKSSVALNLATGELPDANIAFEMANMPIDSFDFDQEPMTQFKFSMSQKFERGKTLALKKSKALLHGQMYPYQRQNRKAKVELMVTSIWLNIYEAQQSILLVEQSKALLTQLLQVVESGYENVLEKTSQSDIIGVQLAIMRFEERLIKLKMVQESQSQEMYEWLNYDSNNASSNEVYTVRNIIPVSATLPVIKLNHPEIYKKQNTADDIYQKMKNHPMLLEAEQKINSAELGIHIAKEQFKPSIGLKASYGYRETGMNGQSRPDFLSLGVNIDVPLFGKNRQNHQLTSAIENTEALRTDVFLLQKRMLAQFFSYKAKLLNIRQRQELYENKMLPQIEQMENALLNKYAHEKGLVKAILNTKIDFLKAQIDLLNIKVEHLKLVSHLNYFFVKGEEEK